MVAFGRIGGRAHAPVDYAFPLLGCYERAGVAFSPLTGSFKTNIRAKVWWVVHLPSGRRWPLVRNPRKWCRENAHLFEPDSWEKADGGLRLVQWWLSGKMHCDLTRWKDWSLYREAEP